MDKNYLSLKISQEKKTRSSRDLTSISFQVVQEEYQVLVCSHKDGQPNRTVLAGEENPPELLTVTRTVTGVKELLLTPLTTRTVGGR